MAFLCLRGATSFHWLNKIFFHLFNLNRGCVLSFLTPSPLSLTHTHTFLYTVLQRARHQSKVFGMRQRCWQICDCLLACVRVCARACTLANHLVMSLYTCPCSLYLIQTRGSVDLLLPSPCPQACSHWLIFKLSILFCFLFFLNYIANHNQWCVMRMKTCMVLLMWYCVHTSKRWLVMIDGERQEALRSPLNNSSYCILLCTLLDVARYHCVTQG